MDVNDRQFRDAYPTCCRLVTDKTWTQLAERIQSPEQLPGIMREAGAELGLAGWLHELARLELYAFKARKTATEIPAHSDTLAINPTLQLFENSWKYVTRYFYGETDVPDPVEEIERVIAWCHPVSRLINVRPVAEEDLLVMKMAIEELSVAEVAEEGKVGGAVINGALIRALDEGIITGPEPRIKRNYVPERYEDIDPSYHRARIFTLQWHITQACDLHCRHCYDRQQYKSLSPEQETAVLDDLFRFCSSHNVHGQVTFTGGNPLLHPRFEKLYREASERGFTVAVLGNPTDREQLVRLKAIQPPAFYQVSLEGLEEHNDYMRGQGHFKRVLTFLDTLREMDIFSMVMLTLTRDNMEQVLPLAEELRHRTDLFTFNRLSLVGEGASLSMADREKFPGFLRDYYRAVDDNPCLGLKDNLLNIIGRQQHRPLFGGCTGFGCGAAFNFITILADGSVHACRKFPSPLGNILDKSLETIYHSSKAERYRAGATECADCSIRPVCGGCLAVAHSHGRDIFTRKDPYCFIDTDNAAG